MERPRILLGTFGMILDPLLDLFRGRAVTIPPMDGALRPNTLLEDSTLLREAEAPDSLVTAKGEVLFASGKDIRRLADGATIASFSETITALAANADGALAAGLESGRVEAGGKSFEGFKCPVALAFGGPDELYVCNGSDSFAPSAWAADLMNSNASGSVWRVNLRSGERSCMARNLAFPYGAAVDTGKRRLIVSESWRHRVISVPLDGGSPVELLAKLPGYPARIVASPSGYVLPLFAPRNRLIEFVLIEKDYREAMMREIDPRYWIAPSLSAARSFLEPLQNGGVRSMGIHKPWSPSRSCGLVVELDTALQPLASYHSRANGTRHGITSAIMHDGAIIAASKGSGAILRIMP